KDAGRIAGLEVLRLVNEPTAAALAYGLHKRKRGYVAVYDFGGGTFDISILKLVSTMEGDIYQVLSTNGDTHLGGDDIDNEMQRRTREKILQLFQADLTNRPEDIQELRQILIAAKHVLSAEDSVMLRFNLSGGKAFEELLTRTEFEKWIQPIIARTMAPVRIALADAKLIPSQIEEVVLVGGSTRIPLVRKTV